MKGFGQTCASARSPRALDLFTVLQRNGIPSKLLYFPDEGHWVPKPQNSELWHRTIFEWLAEYLKQ